MMEYLVTMTTHVPAGTPDEAVADVRAREAAHTRELAAQGHILRLWRPPLAPGEWRTLGLFAAADGDELQRVLASMPLRVWRTDEVTPLGPHPNDPGAPRDRAAGDRPSGTESLTVFTVVFPDGTPREVVEEATRGEARSAHEFGAQGHLIRLWALQSEDSAWRALGLWRAEDEAQLTRMLDSLPLDPWMTVQTTPLTPHPSDPGVNTSSITR
ncbi:muconolactone Delta-isomerase family protein [Trebonia sp.]|uniref:muconolactone Delta-isomerase family protein n=1 Tax=Trebonia sp. TaxID=2767075 RepID=UPI003CC6D8A4